MAAVLQAFGVISYEDETKTYRMLAFNDGRFLEANVKLLEGAKEWSGASCLEKSKRSLLCASTKKTNGRNSTKSLSVHSLRKGLWRSPSADRNSFMNLALHETATTDGNGDFEVGWCFRIADG
jgi:hypothetical protein